MNLVVDTAGGLPDDSQPFVPPTGGAIRLQAVPCGAALLRIDPVLPPETVFLFGAGRVAQPTARLAAFFGLRVPVVDERADFACRDRFPAQIPLSIIAVSVHTLHRRRFS
jgi:xanthine/CO dehydrogenase XdhC/CoxF family maturation factor